MTRVVLLLPAALLVAGCGVTADATAPRCDAVERVALVAQSVPAAAYVPCVRELPPGWRVTGVESRTGSTSLSLLSDRADGREVTVVLRPTCDPAGATPVAPRAEGVRSSLRLRSVTPAFAGTAYDVFPGGCVSSTFSFETGPHIPLMEELSQAIELVPRRELRTQVRDRLGVELDP